MKSVFQKALTAPVKERGYELKPEAVERKAKVGTNGGSYEIGHGAVVIAAITSCTNTSNPSVMVAAGLLARKAVEKGLKVKPYVKTSLAPGSRVVTDYLKKAGLIEPLAKLGFNVVGYGCTTCIGNSGPLPGEVAKAVTGSDLVAAAVISGNRNFEGRVHPLVKANYLASPPLVVAYALAGTVNIDLSTEPIGMGRDGPVYLKDIWPTTQEVAELVETSLDKGMFEERYASVFEGSKMWKDIKVSGGDLFQWDDASTYIHHPPFFQNLTLDVPSIQNIQAARVLALLGDSITTDHISPAGNIAIDSPAGQYLQERDVQPRDFNSYGARRGNDLVMTRGTFANIRLKNLLAGGKEGWFTRYFGPGGERINGRGNHHLRCGHEISGARDSHHRHCRQGIWDWFQPRLGGEGSTIAGCARSHRRVHSNASTARTWSAWASCRCASWTVRMPKALVWMAARSTISKA